MFSKCCITAHCLRVDFGDLCLSGASKIGGDLVLVIKDNEPAGQQKGTSSIKLFHSRVK